MVFILRICTTWVPFFTDRQEKKSGEHRALIVKFGVKMLALSKYQTLHKKPRRGRCCVYLFFLDLVQQWSPFISGPGAMCHRWPPTAAGGDALVVMLQPWWKGRTALLWISGTDATWSSNHRQPLAASCVKQLWRKEKKTCNLASVRKSLFCAIWVKS